MHYSYLTWSCGCSTKELRSEDGKIVCASCEKEVRQNFTLVITRAKEVTISDYPGLVASEELARFARDLSAYTISRHHAFLRSKFMLPLHSHQIIRRLLDELESEGES